MMAFGRDSDLRRMVPPHHTAPENLGDKSWALGEVEVRVWREAPSAMIAWEHPRDPDPAEIPADAIWFIERSSSPYGPWHNIARNLIRTTRRHRDDDVNQSRANSRFIFYRVRWTSELEASERVYGQAPQWDSGDMGGVTWGHGGVPSHAAPAVNREIRARTIMLLSTHTGEPCLVYRPSWLNPLDPQKVNVHTGTYVGEWGSDLNSLGQPFMGGYDHPFITYVDGGASTISVQLAGGKVNDMHEGVRGEVPYWPPLQPDDVLRFYDGQLAAVSVVTPVMHLDHVNSYVCQLSELERTDVINALPMPTGFKSAALFPRRQAARSMNMEAYRRDLDRGSMRRASIEPPSVAPGAGEEDR